MKSRLRGLMGFASLAAVNAVISAQAHAQTQVFPAVSGATGISSYALLNGDNLTLYMDALGDLAGPRQNTAPFKPGGAVNGSNQPYILANGAVDTKPTDATAPARTYGALYNTVSQANTATLQAAIQNKYEYITMGTSSAQEGWGVKTATSWAAYSSFTNSSLSVSGSSINSQVSATSVDALVAKKLSVSQVVSFNQVGAKNIADFSVTFTNTGVTALTGLQYVRYINPNQDAAPGGSGSTSTNQSFGTKNDPNLFGINSQGPTSLRDLALGVHSANSNSAGSDIYAISGTTSEANALTNPIGQLNNVNYVQLGANGLSATYTNRTNANLDATSTDWMTPGSFKSNNLGTTVTPTFSTPSSDIDLELLSPLLGDDGGTPGELFAGDSTTFSFYYVFDLPAVPEPGTLPMLLGGIVSLGGSALRARRRNSR